MTARGLLPGILICLSLPGSAEDIPSRPLSPGNVFGDGLVIQLAHSPNGRLLAILTTAGFQVRDAEDGRLLNSVPHAIPIARGLAWSSEGQRLALAADGIEIWDPLGKAAERVIPFQTPVQTPLQTGAGDLDTVEWSPNGKQLAAGSKQAVVIFDLVSGGRIDLPLAENPSGVQNIRGGFSWSPDGAQLALTSGAWTSEVVNLWDSHDGRLLKTIHVSDGKSPVCYSDACDFDSAALLNRKSLVRWSPDGQMLAVGSQYSGLSLWGRDSRLVWRRSKTYQAGGVTFLGWSSQGKTIHVGSIVGIRYVRPDTGSTVFNFEDFQFNNALSVSGDEQHRAETSLPGVDLWAGRERLPKAHIEVATAWNLEDTSQDLTKIAARSLSAFEQIWDLQTGHEAARLPAQIIGGYNSSWSPRLDLLAQLRGISLNVIRVLDGAVVYAGKLPKGSYLLDRQAWSPDGKSLIVRGVRGTASLVVSAGDGRVIELSLGDGHAVWGPFEKAVRIPGQAAQVLLQTPDRRWAAEVDSEWTLKEWDLAQDPPVPGPQIRIGGAGSVRALSPDGKSVAYISAPGVVEIRDMATARIVERWTAPGASKLVALFWRDKLAVLDELRGAARLWREP